MSFWKITSSGLALLLIIQVSSCKLETTPDPIFEEEIVDTAQPTIYSDTPVIVLEKTAPTAVKHFGEAIVFTIEYTDGNGNLGFASADSMSVEVVDNRQPDKLIEYFHVPPLAPEGSSVILTGVLNIQLDRTAILDDNNTTETTTFSIRMRDRTNYWSNVVESELVTVKR